MNGDGGTSEPVEDRQIVAVRTEEVRGHPHVIGVKLKDGTVQDAGDVIAAIDAHEAHYVMLPPEGAPAYRAHQETGLPLLVEVVQCGDCNERVLAA